MRKFVFSSESLPPTLDERARLSQWQDHFAAINAGTAISFDPQRRFFARFEGMQFGAARIGRFAGTMTQMNRSARMVSAHPNDDLCIGFNMSSGVIQHSQNDRDVSIAQGAATLSTNDAPALLRADGSSEWLLLAVKRERLDQHIRGIDDEVGNLIDPGKPAFRLLRSYLAMLLADDELVPDQALAAHVEGALFDLLGQVLNGSRESTAPAGLSGARAARLAMIMAAIKAEFADPGFSLARVSIKLGMSPRYVQEILYETGSSFTEHVLEMRLQKARAMLAERRHDNLRISDIAEASGFNEVSYFHRCFRRRFGCSPTQYRGGNRSSE